MLATGEAVTLILATIDRIRAILGSPEKEQSEPVLARVSAGIHQLEGELLVIIDIDRVL